MTEPILVPAFDSRVFLNGTPPKVDCRVVAENEYQRLLAFQQKYEKCIQVIERFDPGIIGMYDL